MPEVDPEFLIFWEGWEALSHRRQRNSSGPQAIPVSEILAYCTIRRIDDPDEREDMYYLITLLDGIYLESAYRKR